MVDLLKWQHAGLLLESPWPIAEGHGWVDQLSEWTIHWVLQHPSSATIGFIVIFLVQASFIAVFFTRRLDPMYPWLLLLFVAVIGLLMRLDFSSMLLLAIFFIRTGESLSLPAKRHAKPL